MELYSQAVPPPSPETIARWVASHPQAVWLDSALPGHPRSRYSLVALEPGAVVTLNPNGTGVLAKGRVRVSLADPWKFFAESLASFRVPAESHPFFSGGWVGFLSYESYGSRGKPQPKGRAPGFPDGVFFGVDTGLILDSVGDRAWVFSLGFDWETKKAERGLAERRIRDWVNRLARPVAGTSPVTAARSLRSNFTRERYRDAVREIREALFAGDCYQVNLSQKFFAEGDFDSASLYLKLRAHAPAPQMAFLNLGDSQILSASPELLLEIAGGEARSYPIKGTRPRSADPEEDRRFRETLLASSKDAAELLMIVDLVRNDLGRFCVPGSVRVPQLRSLETFPLVHHLVATVQGTMRPEVTPWEALLAVSPGGSITGAPKLKAMEIIDRLEPDPRGIFTGSIGYADFSGRAAFNIAIRTAWLSGKSLEFGAGGGIVADSDPEAEYEETLHKARGFFEAIGADGGKILNLFGGEG
jgi:para-aminobenzoate synthetase component 1